jgi:LysR family transcriptional regulator, hydrogen peroxide-inducible genes activator
VPFTHPAPSRRIALAYRRSFPRPAAIAAIRDAVARCRAKSPPRKSKSLSDA